MSKVSKSKRKPGFGILPKAVLKAWPGLSPSAKAVVGALAGFADEEGASFPSVAALMQRSGLRRDRSVHKAIAELRSLGIVEVTRRAMGEDSDGVRLIRRELDARRTAGRPSGGARPSGGEGEGGRT